jgi:hypothetical protein
MLLSLESTPAIKLQVKDLIGCYGRITSGVCCPVGENFFIGSFENNYAWLIGTTEKQKCYHRNLRMGILANLK